ncbi:SDR family NAD(P)-dependent oxidoreductase [Hyphococcus sp.]|uniref:SDR family NAD(P)-dependent oxidoreductase n=1 Tax=Hyphococcus sp. TaxID=2038636 RepID=UPI0035C77678
MRKKRGRETDILAKSSEQAFSALVIGASGGIGAAVTQALENDPQCAHVIALSRSRHRLDLTDEDSVAKAAQNIAPGDGFDLVFNAAGILEVDGAGPEKAFKEIDAGAMAKAFAVNAVGTALAFKYFLPMLKRDGRTAFATLSARVGSIGDNRLGGWMSYRASKAALNQIVRCAAIEQSRQNKASVVVALHPGTIQTPLTEKYAKGRYTASPEECAQNLLGVLERLSPEQSGGFFDYAGEAVPW